MSGARDADERQAQSGEHRVDLMNEIEWRPPVETFVEETHPDHERQTVDRRCAAARRKRVDVKRRRQAIVDVDALSGDVQLVTTLGQSPDEAERDESVSIGQMVRQDFRRMSDEDAKPAGAA